MKRIRRIVCSLIIVLSIFLLCGCGKNYSSITYKRFVEKMANELSYSVSDRTLAYQDIFLRHYVAISDGVTFAYYEFNDEKEAKKYIENNYKKNKSFSYSDKKDYSIATSSKGGYYKMIQIDNTIIYGYSENKSNKSIIKKTFKGLGY